MATIPGVSNNELIRTTWGNTVATELNSNVVKNNVANQTVTGPLIVSGSPAVALRRTGDSPHLEYQTTGGTVLGYLQYQATSGFVFNAVDTTDEYRLCFGASPTPVLSVSNSQVTSTNDIQVGGDPGASATGALVSDVGAFVGLRTAAGINLQLHKSGAAAADGQHYAGFFGTTTGTVLGTITRTSASSVAYQTSSDPRIKTKTGDAEDSADIVAELGAKVYKGRYNADEGAGKEWLFVNSTDVEDVAPYAVTGSRDAVDGEGNPIPQQLDRSALVPLLLSALSQALDRVEDLTARVAALEAAP